MIIFKRFLKDRQQSIGVILAVGGVSIHDIYLNTQLRTLYIDINIVEIYAGSDM